MSKRISIVIEKHSDGYIGYPLGIKGAVVGQGDTYEEALECAKSLVSEYLEVFGNEVVEEELAEEATIVETDIPANAQVSG